MFIAEWFEGGKKNSLTFYSEKKANEFAVRAYMDCLVSVSVRPM